MSNALSHVNANLIWVLVSAFFALAAGTIVRLRTLRSAAADDVAKRLDSLRSWWIISVVVALAVLGGELGVTLLLVVVSWLALREFLQLIAVRPSDRFGRIVPFLLIPAHFALVYFGAVSEARVLLPLALLILTGTTLVLTSETKGFTYSAATLYWGALLTTYALSHAAMLTTSTEFHRPAIGSTGLFLFVVLLTELNDIAQAITGRRFGRRKITPIVSPNKTWEGLAGGMTVTGTAALFVSPWLLPAQTSPMIAVSIGLILSVVGFLGDIHMSALKRDIGVKDSGTLLPGQGGMLDRIDSLTFTAPTFFYLATWLFTK